jgi:hypothetical protein
MKYMWIKALLLALFISTIICWPTIFGRKSFFFGDNFHLIAPQKIFFVNQIKQGVFPFWNPYILSGTPFLADINQAIFYPSTLLFLILPIADAFAIIVFVHLVVAGMGQYFLSKSLKGSEFTAYVSMIIWMLSQPLLMSINHVNITLLQVYSWLPWILGSFLLIARDGSKKFSILMPFFLSLAILAGHPQPLLYLIFPAAIYFFINPKRLIPSISLFAPGLIAAFFMTAALTIPFIELFKHSTRAQMGLMESLSDSINPIHYIDFLIPNFFSDPANGIRWGIYWIAYRKAGVYMTWLGAISLFLSAKQLMKSKDNAWLYLTVLLTLIMALGTYLSPINYLVQNISLLQSVRNYSLLLILLPLTGSILVGKAIELLFIRKNFSWLWIPGTLFLISSLFLYIVSHHYFPNLWSLISDYFPQLLNSSFHNYARDEVILQHISKSLLYSSAFFLLMIMTIIKSSGSKRIALLISFLITNMYLSSKAILVFGNREIYNYAQNPIVDFFDSQLMSKFRIVSSSGFFPYTGMPDYWANVMIQPPFADSSYDEFEAESNSQLINRRNVFGSNWNMPYNLQSPFGSSTFVLNDTANYWKSPTSRSSNINEIDNPKTNDARLDDLGVKYFIVDKTVFSGTLPEDLSALTVVEESSIWAIYENPKALPIIRFTDNKNDIEVEASTVNHIVFTTSRAEAGEVAIKMAYYPGWKCTINSLPCTILKDDFGMKIQVPAGEYKVNLDFLATGWPLLAYLSAISWIGYFSFIYINRKLIIHSL